MIKDIFGRLTAWPGYFMGSTLLGIAGLAVIFVKNTQNKDLKALQIKLDELIASNKNSSGARLQDLTEDELDQLQRFYKNLEAQRTENISKPETPEKDITYYRYK
ncbi:low affinity iron permease family protein [Chryseobacterium culicis]|uniref:low affinity iron permease family protein n=1 Tax=Chryseobacterium culicis TaxID=680127 RepID=UPI001874F952|nr:low affinity iron permease family protein [Chryseobacterium culicis]MBE4949736.1 low affinity iron permease family protein [Chryseobacterium culicis]